MTDDALENLNAERRRQWDERKEPDARTQHVARWILAGHSLGDVQAAFMRHLERADYPPSLKKRLKANKAGPFVSYVVCHVAAILEPERRKELGV